MQQMRQLGREIEMEREVIGRMIAGIAAFYLIAMSVIDIRKKEIPVFPGIACTCALTGLQAVAGAGLRASLAGAAISVFLWGVSRVTAGAIGEGDALIYAVTGAALGFWLNLELLAVSLFFSAVAGIALLIARRVSAKSRIPFVPFVAVGYGVVMLL